MATSTASGIAPRKVNQARPFTTSTSTLGPGGCATAASRNASRAATSGRSSRAPRAPGRSSMAPATSTTTSSRCRTAPTARSRSGPSNRGRNAGRSGGSTVALRVASIRPSSAVSRTASAPSSVRQLRGPADPRPLPVVRHHPDDVPLGAGLLGRRRRDLGGQLDHGVDQDRVGRDQPTTEPARGGGRPAYPPYCRSGDSGAAAGATTTAPSGSDVHVLPDPVCRRRPHQCQADQRDDQGDFVLDPR